VAQALRGGRDDRGHHGGGLQFILVWVFEIALSLLGAVVACWFSRWREFRADAGGASLAGAPAMIGALRSLQRVYGLPAEAEGSPAFQTMKISGKAGGLLALLSTHPPLEERIARLERSWGARNQYGPE
jgi:heat shock protein HtpX